RRACCEPRRSVQAAARLGCRGIAQRAVAAACRQGRVMMSLGEKVFWLVVAASSIGAAAYGYHRFKQIRPDLYGTPQAVTLPESERKARISEYQQKGDALTRAAAPPARYADAAAGHTQCANGTLVEIVKDGTKTEARAVVVDGKPVKCTTGNAPTIR